jgi:hypothetical protein
MSEEARDRRRLLLDRDADNAGLKHMKRARCAQGDVDYAAFEEWPAIIDTTAYRIAAIGNRKDGSKRSRAMRACHFVTASVATVKGGETIFCTDRDRLEKQEDRDEREDKKECGAHHDRTSL